MSEGTASSLLFSWREKVPSGPYSKSALRLYEKLGGMTGTAETEAQEFADIYGLEVLIIPTNRPVQRLDQNDHIYKTRREKYNAAISLIKESHAKGQPVLVGTASVESSEMVARLLQREKIPHRQ